MNDFFDLDAPLFRFLTRVADMVILSLLWLIGSLPLFTLGISSTALFQHSPLLCSEQVPN